MIISFVFFLLDFISKTIISKLLNVNESINIISNFFNITYAHNEGAAFSMLSGQKYILIIISIFALILFYKYIDSFKNNKKNILAFSLLLGGLIGNLYDRLIYGYVKDFLDFRIFGYNYPVFNLADTFIFCGTVLLIIAIFKGEDYGSSSNKRRKIR